MELVRLGVSDLMVSRLCLGTMLFGEGLDYREASAQMDAAAEHGINFFDSAEMYPVPQRAETQGRSEEYLGRWLRRSTGSRDKRVIATKVAGPSAQMTWLRGGPARVDAPNILTAIEGSLRRLQTDYIDLYQIHWPDRYVPMFGDVDFEPAHDYADTTPVEEQLLALETAVRQGKIRYVGLSNETAWGLHAFLSCSSNSASARRTASVATRHSPAHGAERDRLDSARTSTERACTNSEAMQHGGLPTSKETRGERSGGSGGALPNTETGQRSGAQTLSATTEHRSGGCEASSAQPGGSFRDSAFRNTSSLDPSFVTSDNVQAAAAEGEHSPECKGYSGAHAQAAEEVGQQSPEYQGNSSADGQVTDAVGRYQPECLGLPRVVSVQNAYSLLSRTFDSTLAETCYREKVALLPYSPLAMGLLSGKYHDAGGVSAGPEARLVRYRGRYSEAEGRYPIDDPRVSAAVRGYTSIARTYGMSPAVMALAFVLKHPLVPSVVIGAREKQQLDELAQAVGVQLSQQVVDEMDQIHRMWPNPTP